MSQANEDFSTLKISPQLIEQLVAAIKDKAYGSVEIYIQNHTVTQITEKTITKVVKETSGQKSENSSKPMWQGIRKAEPQG